MMRYTPNTEKECFLTKSMRNLMAHRDTTKAETQPTAKTPHSVVVRATPSSISLATFKREAPSMVGMAIKKENSAAAPRDRPSIIPPRMVDPEREVPGISASI